MNLTLRTRIFVIISVALLLVLAISIVLVIFSNKKTDTEVPKIEGEQNQAVFNEQTGALITSGDTVPMVINENTPIASMNDEEKIKSAVQNIAKIFIERYGSYSTDNPGENLKDLEILSTPDLWKILKSRIDSMTTGQEFVGVTTRAFSSTIVSFEKNNAKVRVISAREENKNGEIRNFNQEAEVELLFAQGSWLVDDVKWK